jgi:hypothetical protein
MTHLQSRARLYSGSQKGQDRGKVALSMVIDAQGNVPEIKQTSDPLGEGLDESVAATDSGELPSGAGRGYRRVAHQFFLYASTISGRLATPSARDT